MKAVRWEEPDKVPQLVRLRQKVAQRLSMISGMSGHELDIRICKVALIESLGENITATNEPRRERWAYPIGRFYRRPRSLLKRSVVS